MGGTALGKMRVNVYDLHFQSQAFKSYFDIFYRKVKDKQSHINRPPASNISISNHQLMNCNYKNIKIKLKLELKLDQ